MVTTVAVGNHSDPGAVLGPEWVGGRVGEQGPSTGCWSLGWERKTGDWLLKKDWSNNKYMGDNRSLVSCQVLNMKSET